MDESITLGATPKNADWLRLFKTGENKKNIPTAFKVFFKLKSQVSLLMSTVCAALNAKKNKHLS